MKNILNTLILVALVVLVGTLEACKSKSVPLTTKTEVTNNTTTKEIIRDTLFEVKADSSFYKALLECQNGKIVVKEKPQTRKGKALQAPKVTIKDNEIKVDCEQEAQKLLAKWKDTYTQKTKETVVEKPVLIEKDLTIWQSVQIWCGRILLLLILAIVVSSFLKWKNYI